MTPGQNQQAGFTLVELLVSLALAAALASFAIGGLDFARRSWTVSRERDQADAVDAALSRLRSMISRTVAAAAFDERTGLARLMYEGGPDALEFVTQSEATALRGGLVRTRLHLGRAPVAGVSLDMVTGSFRSDPRAIAEAEPVRIVDKVTGLKLRYFGSTGFGRPAEWRPDWRRQETLPSLVHVEILRAGGAPHTRKLEVLVRLHLAETRR